MGAAHSSTLLDQEVAALSYYETTGSLAPASSPELHNPSFAVDAVV